MIMDNTPNHNQRAHTVSPITLSHGDHGQHSEQKAATKQYSTPFADHPQIYHDLDDLVPRLPLREAVQDLHIQYRSNPGNMF